MRVQWRKQGSASRGCRRCRRSATAFATRFAALLSRVMRWRTSAAASSRPLRPAQQQQQPPSQRHVHSHSSFPRSMSSASSMTTMTTTMTTMELTTTTQTHAAHAPPASHCHRACSTCSCATAPTSRARCRTPPQCFSSSCSSIRRTSRSTRSRSQRTTGTRFASTCVRTRMTLRRKTFRRGCSARWIASSASSSTAQGPSLISYKGTISSPSFWTLSKSYSSRRGATSLHPQGSVFAPWSRVTSTSLTIRTRASHRT